MVSYLPAPVDLDNRDITGGQHMLGLTRLALGEHRRMLHQPEFISGVLIPLVGKILHGVPDQARIRPARVVEQGGVALLYRLWT